MLVIKWWKKLSWNVKISGSKNACLPIIAASLLIKWKVTLTNVPKIGDVYTFLNILEWIWVKYTFKKNTLDIDSSELKESDFDLEKIKKIRASILLLSPLLQRIWKISIPTPGWCNLWKRSIESHLSWLKDIGYSLKEKKDLLFLKWKFDSWDIEINTWFWVTSTENLIVANVLRAWITTIKLAALEPHVMNLIDFLRKAWANISIRYDHTIIINWVKELNSDFDFEIISDYIQSGTYMIIWALASKDFITIENARIDDLYCFLEKMKEAWVKFDYLWDDKIRVYRSKKLLALDIQTNIFPWFPTDLQSPFAVLMSQADWISKIHEILFEWRLSWLIELEKMWVKVDFTNHHEAAIYWKTDLEWAEVTSWDLRAGAAMVIAWLIASWETRVTNVEYIHRGYDNLLENLKSLWADIEETTN